MTDEKDVSKRMRLSGESMRAAASAVVDHKAVARNIQNERSLVQRVPMDVLAKAMSWLTLKDIGAFRALATATRAARSYGADIELDYEWVDTELTSLFGAMAGSARSLHLDDKYLRCAASSTLASWREKKLLPKLNAVIVDECRVTDLLDLIDLVQAPCVEFVVGKKPFALPALTRSVCVRFPTPRRGQISRQPILD
jgi:hypothetical protein